MNAAHFHLVVNHLPLFAALFGGLILAVGLLLKQQALTKAGLALAVPERHAAFKRSATIGSLALTLVAVGLIGRAANLEGFIRHTEISEVSTERSIDSRGGEVEDHR